MQQLSLSQQSLQPAYGNHYLYKAKLTNHAPSSQLISIQLQLSLSNEKINKWSKIWLDATKSQEIDVYFASTELAKPITEGKWKVAVIGSKARN